MSTIGWTHSVNATSMVDKLQHAHQAQDEVSQVHAQAKALEENQVKRTTVTHSPESEQARLRKEREKEREQRRKEGRKNQDARGGVGEEEEKEERPEALRKIDIRV